MAELAELLMQRIILCRDEGAYLLHEFVSMPDHLHLLLTPSVTTSLEKCLQLIKGGSSYDIHRQRRSRLQIWQSGFHDWTIRDLEDYAQKQEYIHLNPVRAGLVERPEEWLYGSASGRWRMDPVSENLEVQAFSG